MSVSQKLLHLPEKYDLVVGDTFELFYKGVMLCKDPYAYNIHVNCSIGKAWGRKFEVTPTVEGTYPLTITVSDDFGDVIEMKLTNLVVKNKMKSPEKTVNVLCVGDSLTCGGIWVDEVSRRLTKKDDKTSFGHDAPMGDGLSNIRFIGKNTTPCAAGFEGFGGWKFSDYLSDATTTSNYWLTCSHSKSDSDQESIYKDENGVEWQLETIEKDRLKFKKSKGVGTMKTSGTLTWVSGGMDTSDITFSKSALEAGNPFVYNGQIDFTSYCADVGVEGIDVCYILLGWNNAATDKEVYKSQAKQFIELLLKFNPDMKIVLLGLQIPSLDGCANNYGAQGVYANFRALQEYVFSLDEIYAEIAKEYENVSSVNVSGQFDTEYSMQTFTAKANARSLEQVTVQSNGVHPNIFGYYQIADAVYRHFNNNR